MEDDEKAEEMERQVEVREERREVDGGDGEGGECCGMVGVGLTQYRISVQPSRVTH